LEGVNNAVDLATIFSKAAIGAAAAKAAFGPEAAMLSVFQLGRQSGQSDTYAAQHSAFQSTSALEVA
jgi:hypothetical protein